MTTKDTAWMRELITVHPRELAHCKNCCEPLYVIYDQSLRDFCHECMVEMSLDMAERVVGKKRKK